METEKKQEGFHCLDEDCKSPLERIAMTKPVDGGACGDFHHYEFYKCTECKRLHYRMEMGTWGASSYEREQKNIRRCNKIPSNVEFLGNHSRP